MGFRDVRRRQCPPELAEKIGVSKSQMIRYESKGGQPPADIFGTSVDYLINGDSDLKALNSLKNATLLQRFKEVEQLPEHEQNVLLEVVTAFIRDFKAKQAYSL